MSDSKVRSVVVLGGGTAGWLSAAYLAAQAKYPLSITVIEAPDIPTVGVGEGTWPTMRATLAAIGIGESEFMLTCDASFKQGSRFDRWCDGSPGDSYLHPFTAPPEGVTRELLGAWQQMGGAFAAAMTPQATVCAEALAPRQAGMPDFAGALNYAYHFDAGKFTAMLARMAVERFGVRHLSDRVVAVEGGDDGTIRALRTERNGSIAGDLFLDCSGQAALLIGGHLGSGWIDRSDVCFNDRALAVQVPTPAGSAIASQTVGTAHRAGWIWDIALPERRGIGCVYASRFMDDGAARDVLLDYVAAQLPDADLAGLEPRCLAFPTGYRERLWQGNCIAIGQSAGFIEPLEASAIVMIELSLRALVENFPQRHETMPLLAERFNTLFHYRWERIVEFLKLHYVLSRRDEPYWHAHRDPQTIPPRLAALLQLWRDQPPSFWDFPHIDEVFPAASQQFVLYGMGHAPPAGLAPGAEAGARLAEVARKARVLASSLPVNRAYLDQLRAAAAAKEPS